MVDYAVNLVHGHARTRRPDHGLPDLAELIAYGASPRASIGLVRAGRALALLRGDRQVLPDHVFAVAPDVLRHRLVLSYEALAEEMDVEQVINRILSTIPAPMVSPTTQDPARLGDDGYRPS